MFTGIIEASGLVKSIVKKGGNYIFTIESSIGHELKVDQSVSHNGVCLTVTSVVGNQHEVVAIEETLSKTSLGTLQSGSIVNLERCMVANGRFDGHIVQGHVDQIGECIAVETLDGSWLYDFSYDPSLGNITVEKGSICINGVSLTCFNSTQNGFRVAIIPYTYEHTNFKQLLVGGIVNLEFDIIGKYLMKLASINSRK
jgi:riboflavin synthase